MIMHTLHLFNSPKKTVSLEREEFQHEGFHFIFALQELNFKPVDYIHIGTV